MDAVILAALGASVEMGFAAAGFPGDEHSQPRTALRPFYRRSWSWNGI
jgi:hypothetical protein